MSTPLTFLEVTHNIPGSDPTYIPGSDNIPGSDSTHLALGGIDVELVGAEGVVPHVAHVVPVPHHAVLHGVVHLEHRAQLGRLVADHQVLHLNVVDAVRSPVEDTDGSYTVLWTVNMCK